MTSNEAAQVNNANPDENSAKRTSALLSSSSEDGQAFNGTNGADKKEIKSSYRDFSRDLPPKTEKGRSHKEPAHTFPMKLHAILSNPEFQDIIAWLPHGRAWRILQHKAFEEKVIPLFFRHGRYSSFARQVNGWGFRRITHGPDYNAYYHEMFLRGLPHLCARMKRLTSKDMSSKDKKEDGALPDFYALSRDYPLPDPNASASTQVTLPAPPALPTTAADTLAGLGSSVQSAGSVASSAPNLGATGMGFPLTGAGLLGTDLATLDRQRDLLQRMMSLAGTGPSGSTPSAPSSTNLLGQSALNSNALAALGINAAALAATSSQPAAAAPSSSTPAPGAPAPGGFDLAALLRQQQQQAFLRQPQQPSAPVPASGPAYAPGAPPPGGFDLAALLRQQQQASAAAPTSGPAPVPSSSSGAPTASPAMDLAAFIRQHTTGNGGAQQSSSNQPSAAPSANDPTPPATAPGNINLASLLAQQQQISAPTPPSQNFLNLAQLLGMQQQQQQQGAAASQNVSSGLNSNSAALLQLQNQFLGASAQPPTASSTTPPPPPFNDASALQFQFLEAQRKAQLQTNSNILAALGLGGGGGALNGLGSSSLPSDTSSNQPTRS